MARLNGTSAGTTSDVAGRRSLAEARTPARATRARRGQPGAQLLGQVRRRHPDRAVAVRADGVERGEDVRGRDGHDRGDQDHARRAVEPVERGDALAAPLDEGRPPGQEERHVGAEPGGHGMPPVVVELGAPRLERGVDGRGRVRRAAGEAGRHRDPLVEPGRQRGRGRGSTRPAATDRRAGHGEGLQHEVVGRRAGVAAGDMERVAVPPTGARLSRSASASGTKTECRLW